MKPNNLWTVGLLASLLINSSNHQLPVVRSKSDGGENKVEIQKNLASGVTYSPPTNKKPEIGRKGVPMVDTEKLRAGNWYNTVMAEIERKSYHMTTQGDSVSSVNLKQGMHAVYKSNSLTLAALPQTEDLPNGKTTESQATDDWKLKLSITGIYANNSLILKPGPSPKISTDTSEALFTHDEGFLVQYLNTEEGTRQNFIIASKPSDDTEELRVQLHVDDAWVINQAGKDELHFALQNQAGGLSTKIIYKDLNAWDAKGGKLAAEIQKEENNNFSLVVAVPNAAYPITIDPLSTTASTTLNGTSGSNFGISVAAAGDVNGDGYSDVVVGTRSAASNIGAAYIYMGSATGLASVAAKKLTSSSDGYFGSRVASAGDVNGDGYGDVIVAAYQNMSNSGAAYVYMGSSGGLASTAAVTLTGSAGSYFGYSISSAGDVNSDGFGDVIIGATGKIYLYKGSATGLSATAFQTITGDAGSSFGDIAASAGDVNGDGYSDIIAGASGISKAFIYHGNAAGLSSSVSATISSPGTNDSFGISVAGAGDVNGDGYSDVIIGASTGLKAYIYTGSSTGIGTQYKILSGTTGSNFGKVVASAGDINADGFTDVLVGASGVNSSTGAAYVFMGSAAGLSTTVATTLNGSGIGGSFGASTAGVGDVNGDGFSDVIVGASGISYNTGAAYIYLGSPANLSSPIASYIPISGSSGSDSNLASAGDVNADGYGDVIMSDPSGNSFKGYVWLYLGSATGLSTAAACMLTSSDAFYFGYSLASAGDVNGDGYSDVVIGTLNVGKVYVYHGNSQGTLTLARTISNSEQRFGFTVDGAGDINADGYADLIVGSQTVSKAYLYLGSSSGIPATASLTLNGPTGINYGRHVAGIGDINGDGYADVMVGACHETTGDTFIEKAFVYTGNGSGLTTSAATTLTAPSYINNGFGSRIVGIGDFNGDGYDDVLLGCPSNNTNGSRVDIYAGSSNGIALNSTMGLSGGVGENFGSSVSAGDFNRDGYADIIVGSSTYNANQGKVNPFYGNPDWGNSSAPILGSENSRFGYRTAGIGDVNGDGFSDMIVGSLFNSSPSTFTYLGNGNGKMASRLKIYNSDLSSPIGSSNGTASNFGIGVYVKPINGPAMVRLVWETASNGKAFKSSSSGRITNYVGYTSAGPWTNIPLTGAELKTLITKSGSRITKMRMRVQYKSTKLLAGQVFSPWIYFQKYNKGILNKNAASARLSGELSPVESQLETKISISLTVYPNPVTDYLKIKMGDNTDWDQIKGIELFNMRGQAVYTAQKVTDGTVNVSDLAAGNYIMRIRHESGQFYNSKFIVRK